jgi:hypothetical protein
VVLSDPRWRGANPTAAVDTIDLFPAIHGAELRTIAVGTAPDAGVTRLFIAARLYDVEIQTSTGTRPAWDVGGVLIVLDVTEGVDGRPAAAIRVIEPLGLGVGDVAVVKRLGGAPDLVVSTASDEDLLFVYDDQTGGVVHAVAHNGLGAPIVGDRSIGLAVSQDAPGDPADVYVAAFGSHLVTHFILDPADPLHPLTLDLIGGLAP